MTARLLLCVMVMAFSTLAGRAFGLSNLRRAALIAEMTQGLAILKAHMLDGRMPLSEALARSRSRMLRSLAEETGKTGADRAWRELKKRETARGGMLDSLTAGDLALLDAFFADLGAGAGDEQSVVFAGAVRELEQINVTVREGASEKARLYTTLGFLAGAAAAVAML